MMKPIILLALVAGAFAQYTVEQQLVLQQQQPLGFAGLSNPLNFQLQQQLLGLQGFGGLGQLQLANPLYNPLLNNPYLLKNPYLSVPITGLPAVDVVKEVDILTPAGISGSVDLEPLDAVIMNNKKKGVGHHEIYTWGRSALPSSGRSTLELGQQARFMNPDSQRYIMRATPLRP